MSGFSQCLPFGDRAANGYMVLRVRAEKGGSFGETVDGGKVHRDVESARARAAELMGTAKYERGGEYQAMRA